MPDRPLPSKLRLILDFAARMCEPGTRPEVIWLTKESRKGVSLLIQVKFQRAVPVGVRRYRRDVCVRPAGSIKDGDAVRAAGEDYRKRSEAYLTDAVAFWKEGSDASAG